MKKIIWKIQYTWALYRSPFDVSLWRAWSEASASWEMNDYERRGEPMPTPTDALYEDANYWDD